MVYGIQHGGIVVIPSGLVKTGMLLAGITALFLAIGYALGGEGGMVMALGFALVTNFISYWFSDSIVLKMYRAQPLSREGNRQLYSMIERLAQRANIPMPKAYIIDSPQPNAFATGRNPQHGAVAVTTGLIHMLDEEELAGVVAHELAHIKNRDTLIMTVTATIAGAIGMLANFALFFGGSREGNRPNPLVGIAIALLAPMAAMLVQMAISRTREYAADAAGGEIAGNPNSLARALAKINSAASRIDNHAAEQNPATAHMFIINPLHAYRVDNLFSTHPSTENRIRALEEQARAMGIANTVVSPANDVHPQPQAAAFSARVRKGSFRF